MIIQWKKIIKFLISAGITGLIYIGLLYVLNNKFHVNIYISISISYIAAMAFYFIVNKLLIYKDSSKSALKFQIPQFAITILINYCLTVLIVIGIRFFTGEVYSGSIIAGIVTTLLAYLVFERIFFRKK